MFVRCAYVNTGTGLEFKLTNRHNTDRTMFVLIVADGCYCNRQTQNSAPRKYSIKFNCLALFVSSFSRSDVFVFLSFCFIIFCNSKTECGQLMSRTNCMFKSVRSCVFVLYKVCFISLVANYLMLFGLKLFFSSLCVLVREYLINTWPFHLFSSSKTSRFFF